MTERFGGTTTGGAGRPGPVVAVSAIARRDDMLLLVCRAHPPGEGRWAPPGGRVEFGESLVDALVREVREETGTAVEVGPLLGWVERRGSDPEPYHFVILDFLVSVVGDAPLTPGDDAADARWVPIERVRELPLVEGLDTFLTEHRILPDPS